MILWDDGWWHWVLIAVGLLGLSPWPGAKAILRKAERKPEILVTDAERRRQRGRRAAVIQVPIYLVSGAVLGYLVDGWPAAVFVEVGMGLSAALDAWLFLRWNRT